MDDRRHHRRHERHPRPADRDEELAHRHARQAHRGEGDLDVELSLGEPHHFRRIMERLEHLAEYIRSGTSISPVRTANQTPCHKYRPAAEGFPAPTAWLTSVFTTSSAPHDRLIAQKTRNPAIPAAVAAASPAPQASCRASANCITV